MSTRGLKTNKVYLNDFSRYPFQFIRVRSYFYQIFNLFQLYPLILRVSHPTVNSGNIVLYSKLCIIVQYFNFITICTKFCLNFTEEELKILEMNSLQNKIRFQQKMKSYLRPHVNWSIVDW